MNLIFRPALASLLFLAVLAGVAMQPARADSAATTRLLVGVAAAAALATELNVQRKLHLANTVAGYLPDGSTGYQDGHIVAAVSGQTWYPGNYGQSVAYSYNQCSIQGNGNNAYGYNGYGYNGNQQYQGPPYWQH